jgi:bacteriocin biosynthesis cyclodehydratase domain-containing protein
LVPGRAIEAAGLPPPLRTMLLELHGTWRRGDLLARAVELGADEDAADALLTELHSVGAVLDAAEQKRALAARRSACVLVSGAGSLVAGVACGLAAAGVGSLYVVTEGEVRAEDVGAVAAADLGRPRAQAVLAAVRRIAPSARVRVGSPRRRPDLAVLTDALHPDPQQHQDLASRGVPQLVVRVTDEIGLVGPLVLPGRSACLRCLDLHRAAADPCWPTVAARLAGWVGSAGPATVVATAALAVEQALLAVDAVFGAEPPPALDGVLELDLRRGGLRRRRCAPHPDCRCGAAHTHPDDVVYRTTTSASIPRPGEPEAATGQPTCTARNGQ